MIQSFAKHFIHHPQVDLSKLTRVVTFNDDVIGDLRKIVFARNTVRKRRDLKKSILIAAFFTGILFATLASVAISLALVVLGIIEQRIFAAGGHWLVLLLPLAFFAGCTNNSKPKTKLVIRNEDNTWTSDALQRGDGAAIKKKVLDDPNYIHQRDYLGDTPLMSVIAYSDDARSNGELVRFLLNHGADPNVAVDDGYTCLLIAIESEATDSVEMVADLIRGGADIHAIGTNGWSPLHMAAALGHVEKARLLIDRGADVNRRKEIDAMETPMMEAAFMGQPQTVQLLLQRGADPSMRDALENQTPLEIAQRVAAGPDPEVVKYLKEEDIKIDVDELLRDMDLPTEQLEMMKQTMKNVDMAQSYADNTNELVRSGNHAEVIRILTQFGR